MKIRKNFQKVKSWCVPKRSVEEWNVKIDQYSQKVGLKWKLGKEEFIEQLRRHDIWISRNFKNQS